MTIDFFDLLKSSKSTTKQKCIVKTWDFKCHSKSDPDCRLAINSVSDFDPASECDCESDFSSALMNLDICIFFTLYLHYVNEPADSFSFPFS